MKLSNIFSSCRQAVMSTVSVLMLTVFVVGQMQSQCIVYFDNEADFLKSVPHADMESFENLPATNTFSDNSFILPGFDLVTSNSTDDGGIYNIPVAGEGPSDGNQYFRHRHYNGSVLRFNFNNPTNAFGINLMDWGNMGVGTLTFYDDLGNNFAIRVTPQATGANNFFGVVNHEMVFTFVLFGQNFDDTYAVDEVYTALVNEPVLACKDINVSLNQNCQVIVVPEMVLAGHHDCADDYLLELEHEGTIISDTIDYQYLDEVISVKVTNPKSGNSCWSLMRIEDKFPPFLECTSDTMNCIEFKNYTKMPIPVDPCNTSTVRMVDQLISSIDCDSNYIKYITRMFLAKDENGNVSDTCTQTLYIERVRLDSIDCPVMDTTVYCGGTYDRDPVTDYPLPSSTGAPTINGLTIWPQDDFFCNYTVTYKDIPMSHAGCAKRFLREWDMHEWWCNEDDRRVCQQMITIIDTVGPVLEIGKDTMHVKVARRGCVAEVDLPKAFADDFCHSVETIDVVFPGGIIHTNGGRVTMPLGIDTVVYRAYDSCYNLTTDTLIVVAKDGISPVAVCEQNTVVSLNSKPTILVPAGTFDDGSFDECGVDKFEVRRMTDSCDSGTDVWGSDVVFCCADIDQEIMVEFRVVDKSGNSGTCMVSVLVQDKTPPTLLTLPSIFVDCTFDFDTANLDVFGKFVPEGTSRDSIKNADFISFTGDPLDGVVYSNCEYQEEETFDASNLDNCGQGFLVRLWRFYDNSNNDVTTSQVIHFVNPNKFDSTNIIWPEHLDTFNLCDISEVDPDNLPVEHAFPRFIDENECSQVGYDYKDEVIDPTAGAAACYKVLRHWTVIDWCQKDTSNLHYKWSVTQVIEVFNTNPPEITSACMDTMRCVYNVRCEPDSMVLIAEGMDDCTPSEDLFWTFKIDLGNDGTFDTIGFGNDASGLYPIDTHKIKWILEDLCGNKDTCEFLFEIRNCKAPTAYCKAGLLVELTPVDTSTVPDSIPDIEIADVHARDFDDGSGHVCGHGVVLSFSADLTDTVRRYNCDSLAFDTLPITIWITDTVTGEVSKCVNYVIVQDNNNVNICPPSLRGNITGLVKTNFGDKIRDVEVNLQKSNLKSVMTNTQGEYAFSDMPLGGDYNVVPRRVGDDDNGISTADLVALQRHLLGLAELSSPYLLIAADANNSESISAADISVLRKLVLGLNDHFENNASWRFVDADYSFPDPNDPWKESFPEEYEIPTFENDMLIDFVGIKIGDLNGDAKVNGRGRNSTRSTVNLDVSNLSFKKDQDVEVAFVLNEIQDIAGYQFTLEWNQDIIEMKEVMPNLGLDMNLNNFGMDDINNGIMTTLWYTPEELVNLSDKDKTIFVLKFRAKESGELRNALMISDLKTDNELVSHALKSVGQLGLRFGEGAESEFFALYQNEPNPWSNSTTIGFYLPNDERCGLHLFDETGRLVRSIKGNWRKGYNEVTLDNDVFPSDGVYYYRLETSSQTSTRKMIFMN